MPDRRALAVQNLAYARFSAIRRLRVGRARKSMTPAQVRDGWIGLASESSSILIPLMGELTTTQVRERLKALRFSRRAPLHSALELPHEQLVRDAWSRYTSLRKEYSVVRRMAREDGLLSNRAKSNSPSEQSVHAFELKLQKKYGYPHGRWLFDQFRKEFLGYSPARKGSRSVLRDPNAAMELLAPHLPILRRLVMSRIKGPDAPEVYADMVSTLWDRLQYFDPARTSIDSFIAATTRNIFYELGRRKRGRHHDSLPTISLDDMYGGRGSKSSIRRPGSEPGDPTHADLRRLREELEEVAPFLSQLSPKEAEVLRLYFFEGLTNAEIGKRMHLHEAQASKTRNAALARLKEAVENRRKATE